MGYVKAADTLILLRLRCNTFESHFTIPIRGQYNLRRNLGSEPSAEVQSSVEALQYLPSSLSVSDLFLK